MANRLMSVILMCVLICATQAFIKPTVTASSGIGLQNNKSNPYSTMFSNCASGNFRPRHDDHMPQRDPSPYTLTVTSLSGELYRQGQIVTVTIEKSNKSAPDFYGFFIRGDPSGDMFDGKLVCDTGHEATFCSSKGWTHSDEMNKASVVCRWTPPDYNIGRVQFQATIVQNYSVFWTGVLSDKVLTAEPNLMTADEKAKQMMSKMRAQVPANMASLIRQFTSNSQGGQGKAFADMISNMGKSGGFGNMQQNVQNIMSAMTGRGNSGQSQGQGNLFGNIMGRGRRRGQGQTQQESSNMWSSGAFGLGNFMTGESGNNANSESAAEMANLPSQFNQFFNPQW